MPFWVLSLHLSMTLCLAKLAAGSSLSLLPATWDRAFQTPWDWRDAYSLATQTLSQDPMGPQGTTLAWDNPCKPCISVQSSLISPLTQKLSLHKKERTANPLGIPPTAIRMPLSEVLWGSLSWKTNNNLKVMRLKLDLCLNSNSGGSQSAEACNLTNYIIKSL